LIRQDLEIMEHEDGPAGEPDRLSVGGFVAEAGPIDVSLMVVTGAIRRSTATFPSEFAVDDMIDAGQAAPRFRPQQTVRVGDDADPNVINSSPAGPKDRARRGDKPVCRR
jgi:hypothetical protein